MFWILYPKINYDIITATKSSRQKIDYQQPIKEGPSDLISSFGGRFIDVCMIITSAYPRAWFLG
jgi:hypothetical protein